VLKSPAAHADFAGVRRLALVGVAVLAGCGSSAHPAVRTPTPAPTFAPQPFVPDDHASKQDVFKQIAARQAATAASLRAAIASARRSPSVLASLRVARLTGRIGVTRENHLREVWTNAEATLGKLTGTRHAELGYVVSTVAGLAAQHMLTADRIDPTFLDLRDNTTFWASAPMPTAGYRTTFGSDPAIFQYYPGHGMQLQPLASWGHANALAGACLTALRTHSRRHPCRAAALTTALDRLSDLSSRRDGYIAWEYYFAYGTGTPPWVSGMTQATAMQALSRGYRALGRERWKRTALRAMGAFELAPPAGIRVPAPGGSHYLLYSFAPGYRVINADLQAVLGLRDTAALTHSSIAKRLFKRGDDAARRAVAGFDTGAWSLYSAHGAESTLSYHDLTAGFLTGLCDRLKAKVYCTTGKRFKAYERQAPKIGVASVTRPRAFRPTELAFTLSKISTVKVTVRGSRGVSLTRDLQLPRGRHDLVWSPPGRGRYHLKITAQGPSGPLGVAQRTIKVTQPKPHKKQKKRRKKVEKRSNQNQGRVVERP
jgi:hypothetical protein